MLDKKRGAIDPLLSLIAKPFYKVEPNTLTWIALGFAFLAGLFFYLSSPVYLLCAALFVFLNGLFDAIDGKIAKLTKKTSIRGDFLDHALDRYADVFMVGGLALSSWCSASLGLLAMVGVLLTSYMGTQSQAVGHKRNYSGLLGRADRLILLMVFPVVQYIINFYSIKIPLLQFVLVYFAIVGNITAIQRFYTTLKWFKRR
jgi:archaetidylinositol phosphate synthase